MPARSVKMEFANKTDLPLTRIDMQLCHGVWTGDDLQPPVTINPREQVNWESESSGFLTGTEGWVKYSYPSDDYLPDNEQTLAPPRQIYVYWNRPYIATRSSPENYYHSGVSFGDITPDCNAPDSPSGGSAFEPPPNTQEFRVTLEGVNADDIQWNHNVFHIFAMAYGTFTVWILGPVVALNELIAGNTDNMSYHVSFGNTSSVRQAIPLPTQSASRSVRYWANGESSVRKAFALK